MKDEVIRARVDTKTHSRVLKDAKNKGIYVSKWLREAIESKLKNET